MDDVATRVAQFGFETRLLIHCSNAVLEGHVSVNPERLKDGVGVLILHPYSLLGGSMSDHVVCELFRACAASPRCSVVLKYNQRGVGRSSGGRNLRGRDDAADVTDLIDFICAQMPPRPARRVVVVGYSWGACVGAWGGLTHAAVVAYVGVSFPVGGLSFLLQTRRHMDTLTRATHLPRLLCLGTNDQFASAATMQRVVQEAGGVLLEDDDSFAPLAQGGGAAAAAAAAQQQQWQQQQKQQQDGDNGLALRLWLGADHFWLSDVHRLAEYCVGWIEKTVGGSSGASSEGAAAAEQAAAAGGGTG